MKRAVWGAIALVIMTAATVSAQQVGEPVASQIGVDTAEQLLNTITVSNFEDAAFWDAEMAGDQGLITVRRLSGRPANKEELEAEQQFEFDEQDDFVLGVKVEFFRRGFNTFSVMPSQPLPIEGTAKTVSVWVVGRNFNHELMLLFTDYFGDQKELSLGKLSFIGWKRLTVAIPPSIVQSEYHYFDRPGIRFNGFRIDTDPLEAFGTYYVYFDGLRATTDVFSETIRDPDDMVDGW